MRLPIVAILAITLTGCPFGGINQINHLPESQPLREPRLINHPGVFTHGATGFAFPESYGNFQRVTAYQYDSAGLDVGIGYNDRRSPCLVVATFYVYPAPRMTFIGASPSVVASLEESWLQHEFARSKQEIEAAHPDLREPSVQASVTPVGELLVQGPRFGFAKADDLSELHLFLYNRQWFLKYRFTYPQACKTEALARLAAFTSQLPWIPAEQREAAAELQRPPIRPSDGSSVELRGAELLSPQTRACLESPQVRAYMESLRDQVMNRWQLPLGIAADQRVVLSFVLDARGNVIRTAVVDDSDPQLAESVLRALTEGAPYPSLVDGGAECISGIPIFGTFKNPASPH